MKKVNLMVVALIALGFTVCSCEKEDGTEGYFSTDQVSTVQDDAQTMDIWNDIDNESDDIINSSSSLKSTSSNDLPGRTVVWTTNNDGTKTAVITYTNFQNPHALNERIKNGVITIVVTGKRSDNTYKRVVTFQNFTINGNKIEGTRTIEKTGDLTYKITLSDGKVTYPDNTYISCSYVRIRTMVDGFNTPYNVWDDAYTFEGTTAGVNRRNIQFTKMITVPVKIYSNYRFPVSGSFTITTEKDTLTLDYGNGARDAVATISRNGRTKEISLRR